MERFSALLGQINAVLWNDYVLFTLLGSGVIFTIWSGFCQFRVLTHGTRVLRGEYDDPDDPGAINHFQALSAALSATVGLGNIGGVAIAISLGGPGAVFWMWMVGLFGMAIKLTEVTLSMLYRNTDDPENPHGGPMWVVSRGTALLKPRLAWLGKLVGGVFCVALLVSAITGGNMFQSWNAGEITQSYFGVPSVATGIVLAILVAMVIIGGIKRIGAVAGRLVPIMIALYFLAAVYVLIVNIDQIPQMFKMIFVSAFTKTEATGAFIGGTLGSAFLFGMKRALFSNEAGQGSSPIAHSAAKTDEPVREGIVAGMEPFIDTLVVCTLTALVILSTGVWSRDAESSYILPPRVVPVAEQTWSLETKAIPERAGRHEWKAGDGVFIVLSGDYDRRRGNHFHRLDGIVRANAAGERVIEWGTIASQSRPELSGQGVYAVYGGATLTAKAFDSVVDGLGKWLVTISVWLFAISTIISWSYYGEQCMVYMLGERSVLAYKLVYCLLIIVPTIGFLKTDAELDNLTGIGTAVAVLANLPIIWIFGHQAMKAYKDYIRRLKSGQIGPDHPAPTLEDLLSGRNVAKKG